MLAARIERGENLDLKGIATVNDGDTLTLGTERIRLRGIDAPEFDQICRKAGADYACGRLSRQALHALVVGRSVECRGWERDRYQRLLGTCSAGGVELNRRLVEDGWAVAYGDYHDAEAAARAGQVGLWAGDFDRPSDWRARHGGAAESQHGLLARALNWLRWIVGWQ
ncbi:MAG: thermonuclease family protein [Mesorhizobium sp.]|nr:thermonuclease family protein [Mesorhizobium sp.]